MDGVWHINLLGGLRAEHDGDGLTVTRFRSQKFGALLAYLVLFPRRTPSREELADLFWPDAAPEAARTNLRTALSSLRRQLEGPGTPAGTVLQTEGRQNVGINPDSIRTDVAAFEGALQAARRANITPEEKVRLLTEAVNLYTGPLLPGFYETWALTERDRLAEAHLRALGELAESLERSGDLHGALGYARRAVSTDPLREEAHRDVIRLLMAGGEAASARRQFDELARLLEEHFGEEPSASVRALLFTKKDSGIGGGIGAGRSAAFTLPPSPPPSANAPAVPSFATVMAVAAPPLEEQECLPTASAPLTPVAPPAPVRLPPTFSRFFGREEEMALLDQSLRPADDIRLVTLSGPAGSGKTRLAVEAARRAAAYFTGGVFFVALASLRDADQLFEVIAGVLGLSSPAPAVSVREQVIATLRDRPPTLLLLDNFEQIVDNGAGLVRALLENAPCLFFVITSRQLLQIEGERDVPVSPLPTPAHPGTPERLSEFASVQLFVDRARAARPDFQLSARNAAAVALLCARLEGIPLALELAAAWAQTLTPAQMLDRLDKRFDLLISRRRDTPDRHATLRAAIEWSYQLLPSDLQMFFAHLSVFRGGWTLEAAEAVTGEANALAFLAELKERSLLVTAETTGAAAAMRFRMLETLRDFAAHQLTLLPNDAATHFSQRHAAYFATLSERAERGLHGAEATTWLDRLESEHDNFRAALEWSGSSGGGSGSSGGGSGSSGGGSGSSGGGSGSSGSSGGSSGSSGGGSGSSGGGSGGDPARIDFGLRIAGALHRFWYMRGYLAEGRRWLNAVLTAPGAEEPTITRGMALSAAAGLAGVHGDPEASYALHTEALSTQRLCNDQRGVAYSLCQLGLIASGQNRFAEARTLYAESLVLCGEIGDEGNKAHVLKCLGNNTLREGDPDAAEALFQESLAMYRRFGDKRGIAMVLGELAQMAQTIQKDYSRAETYLQEHLLLAQQLKDVVHTACALSSLGKLAQEQGDLASAHARFVESLDIFRDGDYESEIVFLLESFVSLAVAQGLEERAVQIQAAAEALRKRLGSLRLPDDNKNFQQAIQQRQTSLGQAKFDRAWAAGHSSSLQQIADFVRETPSASSVMETASASS